MSIENRLYTWIKCNTDFKSYYTTDYSPNIEQAITDVLQLNHKVIYMQQYCGNRGCFIFTFFFNS